MGWKLVSDSSRFTLLLWLCKQQQKCGECECYEYIVFFYIYLEVLSCWFPIWHQVFHQICRIKHVPYIKESSMFSNQEPLIELSITYFWMKLGSQWLHLGNIGSEFYSSTVCAWLESVELRTGPNEGINHLCMDGWQVLSLPVDMCVQYVLHGNTALQVCALAPVPLFSIKDCSSWFSSSETPILVLLFRRTSSLWTTQSEESLSNVADLRLPEASKPHLVYSSSQQAFKGRIMALLRLLQYV